jgi:hypothetical protein
VQGGSRKKLKENFGFACDASLLKKGLIKNNDKVVIFCSLFSPLLASPWG